MPHYPSRLVMLTVAAVLSCVLFTATAEDAPPAEFEGMPLVFSDDFEAGMDRWDPTDANAWRVDEEEGNHVLVLHQSSDYAPAVRSPRSIARIKDLDVGDFVAEVTLKQTGREYGHRDLCLFFNYVDPSHFYYVHLATTADEHANSIFLVNGEPRVSIAAERTEGTAWTEGYHHLRVKRDTTSGKIEVFFDDMEKPVMVAEDTHFASGTIGLGSFDDVGNFDTVRIWGKTAEPETGATK